MVNPGFAADVAYLGNENNATGDPTEILVTDKDRRIVAYAGTSEVAISEPGKFQIHAHSRGTSAHGVSLEC